MKSSALWCIEFTNIDLPELNVGTAESISKPFRRSVSSMKLLITLNPKKIVKILITISVVLIFLSLSGDIAFNIYNRHFGLTFFQDENKTSITTWYSSSLSLACALLLIKISYSQALANSDYRLHWKILASIFFALSITKATSFHKYFLHLASSTLESIGLSIPSFFIGILLILLFFLFYISFFIRLNKRVRRLIFIAVAIYVPGSIFMELIAGIFYIHNTTLIYSLFSGIEELFEMVGNIIFLYALFSYIDTEGE